MGKSKYIPSLVGSRGEKEIEGNGYVKPDVHKGQKLTIGLFKLDGSSRHTGLMICTAEVTDIYPNFVQLLVDGKPDSLTYFDLWQAVNLAMNKDNQGKSMYQIEQPWIL